MLQAKLWKIFSTLDKVLHFFSSPCGLTSTNLVISESEGENGITPVDGKEIIIGVVDWKMGHDSNPDFGDPRIPPAPRFSILLRN